MIEAGGSHTLAIRKDGTLWAWGSNASGQLGDGTGVNSTSPARGIYGSGWVSLAAGGEHSLAIDQGTLFSWGGNTRGQLGDGTYSDSNSPVVIGE